jgi:hypothetical protein
MWVTYSWLKIEDTVARCDNSLYEDALDEANKTRMRLIEPDLEDFIPSELWWEEGVSALFN